MSGVSVAGYINAKSTVQATSASFTLPAGITANSIAYVLVNFGAASTATATLSGWTLVDGPYSLNNAVVHYLFKKTVGTADSSTSQTVTFSVGSAWAITGIVAQATQDTLSAKTQDTSFVTSSAVQGFTPVANNCLAVSLIAAQHAASTATGGTAATGWTRQVDDASGPTTSPIAENVLDTVQLTGQAGVAQAATTVTWASNTRTTKWVLTLAPVITANRKRLNSSGTWVPTQQIRL